MLTGDAVFRTESGEEKQQTVVVAYRDNSDWYFTPPNLDQFWEATRLTEADLAKDLADEIRVINRSSCPIEISGVHAFLDPKYRGIRNLTITLRNRSNKPIGGYSLRLYTDGGSTDYATPRDIVPGGTVEEKKMNSSRYLYVCDGVNKDNLAVTQVHFADGTMWELPEVSHHRASRASNSRRH